MTLFFMALPSGPVIQIKGRQTKALAQAKQIGSALRLFAQDHDGNYPRQGVPAEMTAAPETANRAFACLFPDYTQSERIFGNPLSAYQIAPGPDDRIDPPSTARPVRTLRPGENVYSYVAGLKLDRTPDMPIVLDGTDGTGHYNTDPRRRGGTWGDRKRAVVIREDNSGAVENLAGPDDALFLHRTGEPKQNMLDDLGRYEQDARRLDPATPAPKR